MNIDDIIQIEVTYKNRGPQIFKGNGIKKLRTLLEKALTNKIEIVDTDEEICDNVTGICYNPNYTPIKSLVKPLEEITPFDKKRRDHEIKNNKIKEPHQIKDSSFRVHPKGNNYRTDVPMEHGKNYQSSFSKSFDNNIETQNFYDNSIEEPIELQEEPQFRNTPKEPQMIYNTSPGGYASQGLIYKPSTGSAIEVAEQMKNQARKAGMQIS